LQQAALNQTITHLKEFHTHNHQAVWFASGACTDRLVAYSLTLYSTQMPCHHPYLTHYNPLRINAAHARPHESLDDHSEVC